MPPPPLPPRSLDTVLRVSQGLASLLLAWTASKVQAADPPTPPLLVMQVEGCGSDVPPDNVMARLGLELEYEVTDTLGQGQEATWQARVSCVDLGGVEVWVKAVETGQIRTRTLGQVERSAAVKTRLILVTLVEMIESWEPLEPPTIIRQDSPPPPPHSL